MAKNFSNAGSAKAFAEVNKKSAEKAKVVTVQMISDGNLVDYPDNNEDISDTSDLEESISEIGFTDPIEVTAFDMPAGKYMIVSGHRRRAAGRKCGVEVFPCIVKTFSEGSEVRNYVLLANSYRDSSKDPLLMYRRAKAAEAYLNAIDYKGSVRKKIAQRLGLKEAQIDRYLNCDKLIDPVLDMVQSESVGLSSVQPLVPLSVEDQTAVHAMMQECLGSGAPLTRDMVSRIVKGYKSGVTSWTGLDGEASGEGVYVPHELRDSGLSLHTFTDDNLKPGQSGGGGGSSRNSETRREFDPIAANADDADRLKAEFEAYNNDSSFSDDRGVTGDAGETLDGDDLAAAMGTSASMGGEEYGVVSAKKAKKMLKLLSDVSDSLGGDYDFNSDDVAADALRGIANTLIDVIGEMRVISEMYNVSDALEDALADVGAASK